jgi:hypothetical protein
MNLPSVFKSEMKKLHWDPSLVHHTIREVPNIPPVGFGDTILTLRPGCCKRCLNMVTFRFLLEFFTSEGAVEISMNTGEHV